MKVYALLTLHETGWGTRAGIGDPTAATNAAANASDEKPYLDSPLPQYQPSSQPQQYQQPPIEMQVYTSWKVSVAPATIERPRRPTYYSIP